MNMERKDAEHITEIFIWNGDRHWASTYSIFCMSVDISADGERVPPTVHISLLSAQQPTPADVRRLAREYDYIADIAEALQAEKRAAYAEL